jgi:hypothetical protein
VKKVYFACSITGGRDHAHVYQDIVDIMKAENLHVLSEAFADKTIKSATGVGMKKGMSATEIWAWDLDWIRQSDCIIAEVTQPSLGVGYEIAKAHVWNIPVLALYHTRPDHKLSSMIAGSPNVTVFEYQDITETASAIKGFIDSLDD